MKIGSRTEGLVTSSSQAAILKGQLGGTNAFRFWGRQEACGVGLGHFCGSGSRIKSGDPL